MRRALLAVALTAGLMNPIRSSLLDPLWSFFASLWDASIVADDGCSWDPNGSCQPLPDDGCSFDPNGRCQPQVDSGCSMDPNGVCQPGS